MIRHNHGDYRWPLTLLKPTEPTRDELGGMSDVVYEPVVVVNALKRDKSQTYRQVIGAYVNMSTAYFIIYDLRRDFPIDTDWRIQDSDGNVYVINSLTILDGIPPEIEIEATRLGGVY